MRPLLLNYLAYHLGIRSANQVLHFGIEEDGILLCPNAEVYALSIAGGVFGQGAGGSFAGEDGGVYQRFQVLSYSSVYDSGGGALTTAFSMVW